MFHNTIAETQWNRTTGGQQYYLWWNDGRGPSPLAVRIEELDEIMRSYGLDWYIKMVWNEWNKVFAPDQKKDRDRRVTLDYDKEALKLGRLQYVQAETKAANQSTPNNQRFITETKQIGRITITIIRESISRSVPASDGPIQGTSPATSLSSPGVRLQRRTRRRDTGDESFDPSRLTFPATSLALPG